MRSESLFLVLALVLAGICVVSADQAATLTPSQAVQALKATLKSNSDLSESNVSLGANGRDVIMFMDPAETTAEKMVESIGYAVGIYATTCSYCPDLGDATFEIGVDGVVSGTWMCYRSWITSAVESGDQSALADLDKAVWETGKAT